MAFGSSSWVLLKTPRELNRIVVSSLFMSTVIMIGMMSMVITILAIVVVITVYCYYDVQSAVMKFCFYIPPLITIIFIVIVPNSVIPVTSRLPLSLSSLSSFLLSLLS